MTEIIQALRQDHVHLVEIRNLAWQELQAIKNEEHEDYSLLEDIMRYITGYPDTHHHPTEDVIFSKFKMRFPDAAGDIDRILTEHTKLLATGRRFLEAIQAVEEGTVMRRDEFVSRGEQYLAMLDKHMDAEEAHLFPLIEERFGDADWAEVGRLVQQQIDPVFGDSVDEDYHQLWQRIQSQRQSSGRTW